MSDGRHTEVTAAPGYGLIGGIAGRNGSDQRSHLCHIQRYSGGRKGDTGHGNRDRFIRHGNGCRVGVASVSGGHCYVHRTSRISRDKTIHIHISNTGGVAGPGYSLIGGIQGGDGRRQVSGGTRVEVQGIGAD